MDDKTYNVTDINRLEISRQIAKGMVCIYPCGDVLTVTFRVFFVFQDQSNFEHCLKKINRF